MKPSDYSEARRLADSANLKIFCKNGVYRVYRNTMPRLTWIGDRVSADALLELVKRAAGSRVTA